MSSPGKIVSAYMARIGRLGGKSPKRPRTLTDEHKAKLRAAYQRNLSKRKGEAQ